MKQHTNSTIATLIIDSGKPYQPCLDDDRLLAAKEKIGSYLAVVNEKGNIFAHRFALMKLSELDAQFVMTKRVSCAKE